MVVLICISPINYSLHVLDDLQLSHIRVRHSLLRCNRGKKRCIAPTVEGLTNPTEISDCPAMMSLLLLKNLNLVKAMDMTGYRQIIIVMIPHYYHVIFLHYLIV